MKKLALIPILTLFLITIPATSLLAESTVILSWDANTETDLAGYRIFYHIPGEEFDYKAPIWEGRVDDPSKLPDPLNPKCTLTIAEDGYFVARAFDTSGNESGNSNVVDSVAPERIRNLRRGDL